MKKLYLISLLLIPLVCGCTGSNTRSSQSSSDVPSSTPSKNPSSTSNPSTTSISSSTTSIIPPTSSTPSTSSTSSSEIPPVETYTVTFDVQGHGVAPEPITNIQKDSKITKPVDPSETGYNFEGWYKESGCVNKWHFNIDTVNSNLTLFAKWTKIPDRFFVTFSNSEVPFDLDYGVELTYKSTTSYQVSFTREETHSYVIIQIKNLNDVVFDGYDVSTNAFTNGYVRKEQSGLQIVVYGNYTINFDPTNLESGIKVTNSKVEPYQLYETNMNATYYYDLQYSSNNEGIISYKHNNFKFGKNYNYSIRTRISNSLNIIQEIRFSDRTSTKKFILNGNTFSYTASGAFGHEVFDVTLKLNLNDLSLELDMLLAN